MNLLAFELSTEQCSVALLMDGEIVQHIERGNRPSRAILKMADALLRQSGLALGSIDAIAFGRGPGAFTGLRIAAGVAQGLAFGMDLPLVPVSSLAALAQRAVEDYEVSQVVALLDARMDEVYAGSFRAGANGLVQPVSDEVLVPPAHLSLPDGDGWTGAGPGWSAYPSLEGRLATVHQLVMPDAAAVARLGAVAFANGQVVPAEGGVPVYLRDTVAWKKTSKKSGT